MATIAGFNRKFLPIKIKAVAQEACRVNGFNLIVANRNQLKRGEDGTGNKIRPRYSSPIYAINKQRRNPLPGFGNPDLLDTGAFQAGIYIRFGNYNFTLGSNDSKSPDLEAKYTKEIFALNKRSRREVVPKIYASLFGSLKRQLGFN